MSESKKTMAPTIPVAKKKAKKDPKSCPVHVVVRIRPITEKEKLENATNILTSQGERDLAVSYKERGRGQGNSQRIYSFDTVFTPQVTQAQLYDHTVREMVDQVLSGFNCTVFAYGQTGTGKTFTMEGSGTQHDYEHLTDSAGIIPRSIHHIFQYLSKSNSEYSVRVSFMEIYNEELIDLLSVEEVKDPRCIGIQKTETKPLHIHEMRNDLKNNFNGNGNQVVVSGLEEIPVNSAKEIFSILEKGFKKRRSAETLMNKLSSRSHCIFSILIHTKEETPEGEDLIKFGKLNLVDLAGAENIAKSGADKNKDRSKEAGSINTSLLTLGRVINSLTEGASHVPYRESKLTRLLADSLGGKTKTCIIATVSPSSSSQEETISTLDYASRAKRIHNQPEINQKLSQKELLNHYVKEIQTLKQNLEAARSGNGFYISENTYNGMEEEIRLSKEQITELEDILQSLQNDYKRLENTFSQTKEELREVTDEYDKSVQNQFKLHNKIDKISGIHQENKQNLNSYSETTDSTVKRISQDLTTFRNENSNQCDEIIQTINFLDKNNTKIFSEIQNEIDYSFQNMNTTRNEMLEMVLNNTNQMGQNLPKVEKLSEEQAKMVSNLFKSYNQQTTSTFNHLVQVIQKQEESMKQNTNLLKNQLESQIEDVKRYSYKVEQKIKEVDQLNLTFLEERNSRFNEQNQAQNKFVQQHENAIKQFGQNLMKQLQHNLSQFVHEQIKEAQNFSQNEKERQKNEIETTKQESQQFQNITRHIVDDTSKFAKISTEGQSQAVSQYGEVSNQTRKQFSSGIQELTKEFTSAYQTFDHKVKEIHDNGIQKAKEYVKIQSNNNQLLSSSLSEKFNLALEKETELKNNLVQKLDQKIEKDLEQYHQLNEILQRNKKDASNFTSIVRENISGLNNQSQRVVSNLKEYQPTNKTPLKPKGNFQEMNNDESIDHISLSDKVNTSTSSVSSIHSANCYKSNSNTSVNHSSSNSTTPTFVKPNPKKDSSNDKENNPLPTSPQKISKSKSLLKNSNDQKKVQTSRKSHNARIPFSRSHKEKN